MFHIQMFTYMCLYIGLYINMYLFIKWAYAFLLNAVDNENKSNAYTHYKITENLGEHKVKINDNLT